MGVDPEVENVVSEALDLGLDFFDTAERYGGGLSTALGLGWGECERLCANYLSSGSQPGSSRPTVATKFTPSPWRTSAKSVVEACRNSAANLEVDTIDLYQIHMPDIVQPLRGFGIEERKDEVFWEGLAECVKEGLVRNVGVSNY